MKLARESRELAQYQAALLDALDAGGTPEEVVKRLRRDPRAHAFREYASTFDARSVEALTKLMALWGERGTAPPRRRPGSRPEASGASRTME